ncbi:MAG: hypothetical protein K2J24_02470, partial [Muribaculaceae bacterium]|nr:hypothetical protein [Muribaculaceae bacterium]
HRTPSRCFDTFFVLCAVIMMIPYDALWRYFAWCNQVLAVFTLWTLTVYLARERRLYLITLLPAMFMTAVTTTYIVFAPEGIGALLIPTFGYGVTYTIAVSAGFGLALAFYAAFERWRRGLASTAQSVISA